MKKRAQKDFLPERTRTLFAKARYVLDRLPAELPGLDRANEEVVEAFARAVRKLKRKIDALDLDVAMVELEKLSLESPENRPRRRQ